MPIRLDDRTKTYDLNHPTCACGKWIIPWRIILPLPPPPPNPIAFLLGAVRPWRPMWRYYGRSAYGGLGNTWCRLMGFWWTWLVGDFLGGWDFGANGDIFDGFWMDFGGKVGEMPKKVIFGWILDGFGCINYFFWVWKLFWDYVFFRT